VVQISSLNNHYKISSKMKLHGDEWKCVRVVCMARFVITYGIIRMLPLSVARKAFLNMVRSNCKIVCIILYH